MKMIVALTLAVALCQGITLGSEPAFTPSIAAFVDFHTTYASENGAGCLEMERVLHFTLQQILREPSLEVAITASYNCVGEVGKETTDPKKVQFPAILWVAACKEEKQQYPRQYYQRMYSYCNPQ